MTRLTTGSLGDRRQVGGLTTALRREQRRAERTRNTPLANQLGARLAQEKLARVENGDSNLGSADSDITAQKLGVEQRRNQRQVKANLLSNAQVPTSSPEDPQPTASASRVPTPQLSDRFRGLASEAPSTTPEPTAPQSAAINTDTVVAEGVELPSDSTSEPVDDTPSEPGPDATVSEVREYMAYLDSLDDPENTGSRFLLRRRGLES